MSTSVLQSFKQGNPHFPLENLYGIIVKFLKLLSPLAPTSKYFLRHKILFFPDGASQVKLPHPVPAFGQAHQLNGAFHRKDAHPGQPQHGNVVGLHAQGQVHVLHGGGEKLG